MEINTKVVYQNVTIDIPAGSTGQKIYTKTSDAGTTKVTGIAIPEGDSWTPGFNFKMGVRVQQRMAYIEPANIKLFLTTYATDIDKRFLKTEIPAGKNVIEFVVDLGTTPTPAAWSFEITLRLDSNRSE